MDQKQSDTTVSGDTSSAGIGALRSIFDDPIITSSLMQLGSSEAISGYIPVDEMSARANAQPGLVGPSGVAPVRESNDYSNFVLDDDDVSDKALRKRKALQEKSKRAQRRYRERKKAETEELKKHIEELSARLSAMTAEKNSLQSRNSLLEKVVQVRGGAEGPAAASQAIELSAAPAVPEHVTASATFLGLVYPGRGLEKSVRKEHLDNMTTADFIKVWKDYVNKLTHLLLAADGNEASPACKQIRELVEAQRWAVQCFVRNDMPKLMRVSMDIRRDGGNSPTSLRTVENSRRVLANLRLSLDQKWRIVAVRREFLTRLQNVLHQRATITAAMQRPIPSRYDDLPSLMMFTDTVVGQDARLRALLQEQAEAYRLMQYGVREVLTPLQDARFLVDSYPSPVDPVLMSKLVAEELRDPSANHVLSSAESKFGVSMPSEAFPQFAGDFFPLPGHDDLMRHPLTPDFYELGQDHIFSSKSLL